MSPQYLLVAPLVLGATTVYPGGYNDTLVSLSISCWHHLYPRANAVSPGGSPVILVQLKYPLVTPLLSQCNDSIFGYLLMTPLLPLCYYSISYLPHSYTSVTTVSLGGSTGTVVPLQYILIPSLVHYSFSGWMHLYPCITTLSSDGSTCTPLLLQYFLAVPLIHPSLYSILWWLLWYPSVTLVYVVVTTGTPVPLQYQGWLHYYTNATTVSPGYPTDTIVILL